MCFRFVCEVCRQTLPYFCGPPFANATNDVPNLCRANAHTQQSGFKCADCERLDGVTRHLEAWLRFHAERRAEPNPVTSSRSSSTAVRDRIDPGDPRSPWFTPFVTITNLKKAMNASGNSDHNTEDRIAAERRFREETPAEDEVEETAYHKIDHCCFCLDNFTSLTQECSVNSTPAQEDSAPSEANGSLKRSRPQRSSNPDVKRPRKW